MRFRKSVKICKGLKVNVSKSGLSATFGGSGLSFMKKILILLFVFVLPLFPQSEILEYEQWIIEKYITKIDNVEIDKIAFILKTLNLSKYSELDRFIIVYDNIDNTYKIYCQFKSLVYDDKYPAIHVKDFEKINIILDNTNSISIENNKINALYYDFSIKDNNLVVNLLKQMEKSKLISFELKIKDYDSVIIRSFNIEYLKELLKNYNLII